MGFLYQAELSFNGWSKLKKTCTHTFLRVSGERKISSKKLCLYWKGNVLLRFFVNIRISANFDFFPRNRTAMQKVGVCSEEVTHTTGVLATTYLQTCKRHKWIDKTPYFGLSAFSNGKMYLLLFYIKSILMSLMEWQIHHFIHATESESSTGTLLNFAWNAAEMKQRLLLRGQLDCCR